LTEPNYEYHGLLASTWDLFRGDTSNWSDRFFFRELIERSGAPVLDVGCGTGRLLLDYLAQGVDIDGVDNSPEMIDLCRQKAAASGLAPNLFVQEMERLDLPRRYRTILVPSSSFQLLVDREQARQALDRLAAHLEPGGTLALPFMVGWQEGQPLDTGWTAWGERTREDGMGVRRWSRTQFDPVEQLEHTEERYEVLRDGEVVAKEHHQRSPGVRWYTQEEAVRLCEAAGLTEIRLLRAFTWEPAAETDTPFTLLATRT
jgi:SAM-dependent methyltransferase